MAAGTRRIRTSFAAAGVVENLLQGTPLEYPGVASSIEIASAIEDAGAANIGDVTMDVLIGTDLVAEGIVVPVETVTGAGPRIPDQLLVVDAAAPADHVQIRLRNATAGANDVQTLVRIQPL